jgi:hypothetical protein
VQLLSFGPSVDDFPSDYLTKTRSNNSLLDWYTDHFMITQLKSDVGSSDKCAAFKNAKFTNEVQLKDLHEMARGYWHSPVLE